MLPRIVDIPESRSSFLLGPRQTGKSTLARARLRAQDLYVNLLPQRSFLGYAQSPGRFRDEVLAHARRHGACRCVVDEVQKLPALLDEVHDLIESNLGLTFLLTGSSARKLRRGGVNLLAGRASTRHLFPLTPAELGETFELERALRVGLLPALWHGAVDAAAETDFLHSYVDTYLREEIREEGALRNIGAFSRLLEVAAACDGELLNATNVAAECGVSAKTVQAWYDILVDSFVALRLDPWARSVRRRIVAHPRYYFFDTGVTSALCHTGAALGLTARGRRFEQFIVTQAHALNSYQRWGLRFAFWRTQGGAEVDLVVARGERLLAAIEVKASEHLTPRDARGLRLLADEHPTAELIVVAPLERPRQLADTGVRCVPWQAFFAEELPRLASL